MLRLTLTLVPGGDEQRARSLAEVEIVNVGARAGCCTYAVRATQDSCGLGAVLPAVVQHDPDQGAPALIRRIFAGGSRRFELQREHLDQPLLAACAARGMTEAETIDTLVDAYRETQKQLFRLALLQPPTPLVVREAITPKAGE